MNIAPIERQLTPDAVFPVVKDWKSLAGSDHLIQFYESDDYLLRALSDYVDESLRSGNACIIVATQPHLIELEHILTKQGHDLLSASGTGAYVPLDARGTLSKFIVNGQPDYDLFCSTVGPVIEKAAKGNRSVRIYGEMVALLWSEAKYEQAIRLEQFWNDITKTHNFVLCCGYPIQEFEDDIFGIIETVCSKHSVILPGESYTRESTTHGRVAVITALQQKAKALQREISERKETERQLRASESKYRELRDELQKELEARQELFKREQIARLEAQSANRMKDEFLATVSHELRTPLTSLFGWIRLLRSADLDPNSTSRALEAIERSVQAQRQLVEDLLDVSRIVAGKLRLHMSSVEIESIIEAALETVRPIADAKNITIRLHLDSQTPSVQGDSVRLQQIIWNLLSNAVKFTPNGGNVDISLSCTGTDVKLAVQDSGEGISSDFLPFVFDRFRQADSTTSRKHGGLGLGLAIVQYLVEVHGGSVKAESSGIGMGSTFTVNLPIELTHRVTDCSLDKDLPGSILASLKGLKILVVEDDRDTQEMLLLLLKEWSVKAKVVSSADEALRLLQRWVPDLILSDVGLLRDDGYSLIRKIRALPRKELAQLRAIAVTAYAKSEDRLRAITEGFNMYIPKPIEPSELAAAIYSLTRI